MQLAVKMCLDSVDDAGRVKLMISGKCVYLTYESQSTQIPL